MSGVAFSSTSSSSSPSSPLSSNQGRYLVPAEHPASVRPEARHGHAAAYAKGAVWMHGGASNNGALLDGVWKCEVTSGDAGSEDVTIRWQQVPTVGKAPSPRAGHLLLPLGRHTGNIPLDLHGKSVPMTDKVDKLLLYGGLTAGGGVSSDLFVLDLAPPTPHWYRVVPSGPDIGGRHHCQYRVVCLRDGSQPRLIISGGEGENAVKLRDTQSLDLNTWTWARSDIHCPDTVDLVRSSGGAMSAGGRMVVVGGESEKGAVEMDALLFHAGDAHSPAIEVTKAHVEKRSVLPSPRCLFTLTAVRADGVLLWEELQANSLAGGAAQEYRGAMFTRKASKYNLDVELEAAQQETNSAGAAAAAAASSSSLGMTTESQQLQPGHATLAAQALADLSCSYMVGGCPSLSKEARCADVYRFLVDDDSEDFPQGRVLIERVSMVQEGARPMRGIADHSTTAIPPRLQWAAGSGAGRPGAESSAAEGQPQQEGEPGLVVAPAAAAPSSENSTLPLVSAASASGFGAAVVISRLLVFGGSIAPGCCTNDTHVLELRWQPKRDEFDRDNDGDTDNDVHATAAAGGGGTSAARPRDVRLEEGHDGQIAPVESCCTVQ